MVSSASLDSLKVCACQEETFNKTTTVSNGTMTMIHANNALIDITKKMVFARKSVLSANNGTMAMEIVPTAMMATL